MRLPHAGKLSLLLGRLACPALRFSVQLTYKGSRKLATVCTMASFFVVSINGKTQ